MKASFAKNLRRASQFTLVTLTGLALVVPHLMAAEAPKAWSGTWNNKRYKTTGPLTCTVIGEDGGKWIAKFSGTGVGRPFNYTAYMTPKGANGTTNLTGVTKVDGDTYQWNGVVNAQGMTGSFRSGNGNNGDFRLAAKK